MPSPPSSNPNSASDPLSRLSPRELLRRGLDVPLPAGRAAGGGELAQLFPEFRLERAVARGGFGVVWRVEHRRLKRPAALKILAPALTHNPAALARFEREIEAAGALDHPGIVRTSDAGERGGVWFLAMEWIDGADFGALAEAGPLAAADACELARQAAVALGHAHGRGLIHRDVKPGNLMLARTAAGPVVKVLDFGIAQLAGSGADGIALTVTGDFMGTLDYAAPEQIERPAAVEARADVFGLGATLYHLLAGMPPRSTPQGGDSLVEKILRVAREPAPSLAERRPDLPAELIVAVDRMLALDPAQRPASAEAAAEVLAPFCGGHDLMASLARVLASEIEASPAAPGFSPSAHLPSSPDGSGINQAAWTLGRKRLVLAALGLGVCAAVTLGVWTFSKKKPSSAPEPPAATAAPAVDAVDAVDAAGTFPAALLARAGLQPEEAPRLPDPAWSVASAKRFDVGVRGAHYRAHTGAIHFCTESTDIAMFMPASDTLYPAIAQPTTHNLAVSHSGRWLVWSIGGGNGGLGRGEFANPLRILPSLKQSAPEQDDDPEGLVFIPPRWDAEGSPLRPNDVLVVDCGFQGAPGLWRFRCDSDEPPEQIVENRELLRDSVDVTAMARTVYVTSRVSDRRQTEPVLPEDFTHRILRLHGRRLIPCRTDQPVPDPCGIAADPRTRGLFVLCGAGLAGEPEKRRVLHLVPAAEPDSFTVSEIFTHLSKPSKAGIDLSSDGQRLLISDAGARVLYELQRP